MRDECRKCGSATALAARPSFDKTLCRGCYNEL